MLGIFLFPKGCFVNPFKIGSLFSYIEVAIVPLCTFLFAKSTAPPHMCILLLCGFGFRLIGGGTMLLTSRPRKMYKYTNIIVSKALAECHRRPHDCTRAYVSEGSVLCYQSCRGSRGGPGRKGWPTRRRALEGRPHKILAKSFSWKTKQLMGYF